MTQKPIYTYRFSIPKIQEMSGLSYQAISKRARKLKIKGQRIGSDSTLYYAKTDVEKILAYGREHSNFSSRKIQVVEMYIDGYTGKKISQIMSMSVKTAYDYIREFNQSGCVIIESKINQKCVQQ